MLHVLEIRCHAYLQASASSVKVAATVQQTLSEMQVGVFTVLCSFSTPLKACQSISTFCSQIPLCPYLHGVWRKNQGQSSQRKAQSHTVIQQLHEEKTLIPDLTAALPCSHFEQWLSTVCLSRWIIRYSAVGLYRCNCLLIIHYTLWNTVLPKEKICGGISAFWQSSLGLRYHAGFSFLYER